MVDPFADSIENNVEPPVTNETTTENDPESNNRRYGGVSVTFKFKGEFSSPWVVIHEESAEAALAVTNDPDFKALMDRTKTISGLYDGSGGSSAAPAQNGSQNRAQGRPQGNRGNGGGGNRRPKSPPPGVDQEICDHGPMNYVSGNKNGKDWAAWGCPDDNKGCWTFIN